MNYYDLIQISQEHLKSIIRDENNFSCTKSNYKYNSTKRQYKEQTTPQNNDQLTFACFQEELNINGQRFYVSCQEPPSWLTMDQVAVLMLFMYILYHATLVTRVIIPSHRTLQGVECNTVVNIKLCLRFQSYFIRVHLYWWSFIDGVSIKVSVLTSNAYNEYHRDCVLRNI